MMRGIQGSLRSCALVMLAAIVAGLGPAQPNSAADDRESTTTSELAVPPIEYLAPLSVDDCVDMLVVAIRHLDNAPEHTDPERVDPSLVRMLDSTRAYLRARDDRDSSPYDYEWIVVANGRADRDATRRKSFDFGSSVSRVSVLGFEAESGDVLIREVAVFDEKNREIAGFRSEEDSPWLVQTRFPRRDLFHLWKRSSVRRVEIRFEAAPSSSNPDPVLQVVVGRSDTREYGKTAVFHCAEARRAILAGDLKEARQALLQAHKNAIEFREKIRLSEERRE